MRIFTHLSLFSSCLVLAGLLLSYSSNTQASDSFCPKAFPYENPPSSSAQRAKEIKRLDNLLDACANRPDYYAWLGLLRLASHDPEKAALAFEKALLLNPELPGVAIDYAAALAQIGEKDTARLVVKDVMSRTDISHSLYQWLETLIDQEVGSNIWHFKFVGQTSIGHESNLNSGPSSAYLTLTLPGGNAQVLLDPKDQRLGGVASLSNVQLEGVRKLDQGSLTLYGQGSLRLGQDRGTELSWTNFGFSRQYPLENNMLVGSAALLTLSYGGRVAYEETSFRVFSESPARAGCSMAYGLEHYGRRFIESSALNGKYWGGQTALGCKLNGDKIVILSGRYGVERAEDVYRLGGDQARWEIGVNTTIPYKTDTYRFNLQFSQLKDEKIYSELLGGVRREISRVGARVQYEKPITGHWSLIGSLEYMRQHSNLSLFDISNKIAYLGFQWAGDLK